MANIPVNFGGIVLESGQSTTGYFAGFQVLGTGNISAIDGAEITFRYAVGLNADGSIINSPSFSTIVPAGVKFEIYITQMEVTGGAPVILYT